jgi:hypothetical protein
VFALFLDSCHVPPISCWSLQQSLLFPITTVVIIDPVPKLTNLLSWEDFKKIISVERILKVAYNPVMHEYTIVPSIYLVAYGCRSGSSIFEKTVSGSWSQVRIL